MKVLLCCLLLSASLMYGKAQKANKVEKACPAEEYTNFVPPRTRVCAMRTWKHLWLRRCKWECMYPVEQLRAR